MTEYIEEGYMFWCRCWGQFVKRCCPDCCRVTDHAHHTEASNA